jgi:plasmid maintenance system antidote protein VapI
MRAITPVSPGEMLEEEFLKPLGLTKYRLAKDIGVPPQRIAISLRVNVPLRPILIYDFVSILV